VPAARRVPWTAPPHTSARVAGSAVPAAGQVHAHPRHLRREGRRDLRVGLARRAGPPRTSAHLDAPRHTSAHLGRASAHPRHTGGKQTPRNTSAESRQIWRSLGTHLCTSPSPVAHPACKAGCGSPMTRPRRVNPPRRPSRRFALRRRQEGAADDARSGQLPQRRHKQGRRVGLHARHALEAVRHKDG